MRCTVLLTCLAALVLPAAAQAQAPDVPTLAAELTSCATGASRSATFHASMPAVDGSSVLAVRFQLERMRGQTWKPVPASTFGRWERSAAGAAGFVYDKRVERLAAPASYRVTVRFAWYDADGHVLREVKRRTPVCRQPERRPDLRPARIEPGPAQPDGSVSYLVVVANRGRTDAPSFRVLLSVDGRALAPKTLPGLAASASASATFTGPACRPGEVVRAVVDSSADVAEADEVHNTLVQPCVAG